MKMADIEYGCVMHSAIMEENDTFMEKLSRNHVTGCVFCDFSAVYIMNGYRLSG